jgi:hypothetical protein
MKAFYSLKLIAVLSFLDPVFMLNLSTLLTAMEKRGYLERFAESKDLAMKELFSWQRNRFV